MKFVNVKSESNIEFPDLTEEMLVDILWQPVLEDLFYSLRFCIRRSLRGVI